MFASVIRANFFSQHNIRSLFLVQIDYNLNEPLNKCVSKERLFKSHILFVLSILKFLFFEYTGRLVAKLLRMVISLSSNLIDTEMVFFTKILQCQEWYVSLTVFVSTNILAAVYKFFKTFLSIF